MTLRLPRTLRLDPSDTLIFGRAAEPGEWAVPGAFRFWDEDPAGMSGKRRQEFRGGFLGLGSFGWSTLVEVAEATPDAREAALAALAGLIRAEHGAPHEAAARGAAEEELGFAESLCAGHPPGTVLALSRALEGGELRERFRTLHLRETPAGDYTRLPVFAAIRVDGEEEETVEHPDLAALARGRRP
jgi:hypothetical protein